MKLGTYFSGGGVADIGYKAAGFIPTFAVEYDPANVDQSMRIADCYEKNLGAHVIRKDVCAVDPATLPYVDLFHASPVCKNASVAKAGGEENDVDIDTAKATAAYIACHRPLFVVIENVYQYRKFEAYRLILSTLRANGYEYRAEKLNAADYGVPQTRERLIVTASRISRPPAVPKTHMKAPPTMPSLFDVSLPKWVGWYEAIEDLIPTLPDDKFADWQLKRLPDEMETVLVNGRESHNGGPLTIKHSSEPIYSLVATSMPYRHKAFIMNPANPNGNEKRKYRWSYEPAKTVTAGDSQSTKAFIGRVVRMTPRALARFQSMPDWYVLPEKDGDACCLIGNGVPSELTEKIGNNLKGMV